MKNRTNELQNTSQKPKKLQLLIVAAALVLYGCAEEIEMECPPPFPTNEESKNNDNYDLYRHTGGMEINSQPTRVDIYLDGSGSMKGFVRAGLETRELLRHARRSRVMKDIYNTVSEYGTNVNRYIVHGFGRGTHAHDRYFRLSGDKWRVLSGKKCLRKKVKNNLDKLVNNTDCIVSRDNNNTFYAYTGQSISYEQVIKNWKKNTSSTDQTATNHESEKNLLIIISDMFSFNKHSPGDSSEIYEPLQNEIGRGKAVGLVSIWSAFEGCVFDIPKHILPPPQTNAAQGWERRCSNSNGFPFRGLMPLHVLMVGEAPVLRSVIKKFVARFDSGEDIASGGEDWSRNRIRNVFIFDKDTQPELDVGEFRLATDRPEASHWSRGAAENINGTDAKRYSLEMESPGFRATTTGLPLGWEKKSSQSFWSSGAFDVSFPISAWKLKTGATKEACLSDPDSAWQRIQNPLDVLQIKDVVEDTWIGLSLLSDKRTTRESVYGIEMAVEMKMRPRLGESASAFVKEWALNEYDAPKRLQALRAPRARPAERHLGTLNLGKFVNALWIKTFKEAKNAGNPLMSKIAKNRIVLRIR